MPRSITRIDGIESSPNQRLPPTKNEDYRKSIKPARKSANIRGNISDRPMDIVDPKRSEPSATTVPVVQGRIQRIITDRASLSLAKPVHARVAMDDETPIASKTRRVASITLARYDALLLVLAHDEELGIMPRVVTVSRSTQGSDACRTISSMIICPCHRASARRSSSTRSHR